MVRIFDDGPRAAEGFDEHKGTWRIKISVLCCGDDVVPLSLVAEGVSEPIVYKT